MADITIQDVTTGKLTGTGVFDLMMRTVKAHLQEEFDDGRIKGDDYATVYLGSLQSAMSQAIQFVLQEQISDKQADLLAQQTLNAAGQGLTIIKQNLKLDAEIALLEQKLFTEEAQTLDTVNSLAVVGVMGKQKELLNQQKEGFVRDAEQKVLQTLANTWSVRHTGDGAGNPGDTGNGLNDTNIKTAVGKAMEGINTTPAA